MLCPRQYSFHCQSVRARPRSVKRAAIIQARICYSVLRDAAVYGDPQPRLARKADQASFAVTA